WAEAHEGAHTALDLVDGGAAPVDQLVNLRPAPMGGRVLGGHGRVQEEDERYVAALDGAHARGRTANPDQDLGGDGVELGLAPGLFVELFQAFGEAHADPVGPQRAGEDVAKGSHAAPALQRRTIRAQDEDAALSHAFPGPVHTASGLGDAAAALSGAPV